MAAPVYVHGKSGTVSLNGSLFNALTINFREQTTLEDITYSQSGGATAQVVIPGYVRGSGSISFVYDTANQPTIAPFDLRPGRTNTAIAAIFYPEGTKPFTASIFPESLEFTTGPQAGAVKCSLGFQTSGAITEPSS